MQNYYKEDLELKETYEACLKGPQGPYMVDEGYLFKETKLCFPKCSNKRLLIKKTHGGGLACHFDVQKTLEF